MKISEVIFENDPTTGGETGSAEVAAVEVSLDRMSVVALGLQHARDMGKDKRASQEYVVASWLRWHPGQPLPPELYSGNNSHS